MKKTLYEYKDKIKKLPIKDKYLKNEILEYSEMRNEFDRKIKTALNISQCMVENIRKQVLEEIY